MITSPVRAVLRVRTLGPSGLNPPQIEVINRLETLAESEGAPIAELDVDVWDASMGLTQSDASDLEEFHHRISEFEQWAVENDCTLGPAFKRRGTNSAAATETKTETETTDTQEEVIIPPLLCLAVYDGETIAAVYPHGDGEEVSTIRDGIEALESLTTGTEQSREKRTENEPVPIQ